MAIASAAGDDGATGPPRSGDRRTTVRGGRTFHDDGSCGGFAPLAGSGGGPFPGDSADAGFPGDTAHAVLPARLADLRTALSVRLADLRTDARGEPTCARVVRGTPSAVAGPPAPAPESNGRPPAPPGRGPDTRAPAVRAPPRVGPSPSPGRPLPVLTDDDPARRRTGDAAERIDAPAADAPPAAATTVGVMSRSACPGAASVRCTGAPAVGPPRPVEPCATETLPPAEPCASAMLWPFEPCPAATLWLDEPCAAGLLWPFVPCAAATLWPDERRAAATVSPGAPRAPAPDEPVAPHARAPDGPAAPRGPAPDDVPGLQLPASDRFADAYAAAPVGGA